MYFIFWSIPKKKILSKLLFCIFWAFFKTCILITFSTINDKISRFVQSYRHLNWWTLISFYFGTLQGNVQRLWTLPAKSLGVGNMYGSYLVNTVINGKKIKCQLLKCLYRITSSILHAHWMALLWLCTIVPECWDYYECYQQLAWLYWQIGVICKFCWYTVSHVQHHVVVLFLLVHRGISHKRNHFVPWKHQVLVSLLGHAVW